MASSPTTPEGAVLGRLAAAAAILVALALVVSLGIAEIPLNYALAGAAAAALFVLVFVRTDFGLEILLLSMLLSPRFLLGGKSALAEQREIALRFDDLVILIIAFTWLAKTAVHKELGLVSKTPLNRPIAAYMGACALATAWGIGFAHVRPLAGFFYLLKYLEYFFVYYIAVNNIRTRPQAQRLVIIALATAAIVSIVGIAQIPVDDGDRGRPHDGGAAPARSAPRDRPPGPDAGSVRVHALPFLVPRADPGDPAPGHRLL